MRSGCYGTHYATAKSRGAKFRRQYSFGPYVLDFYCREHRVAVEVDGSQHLTPTRLAVDARRTAFLKANYVRVVRFNNLEVLRDLEGVLAVIASSLSPAGETAGVRGDRAAAEQQEPERSTPHPNPLPQGERE
jgi:very-short-patch-repair endonuclease